MVCMNANELETAFLQAIALASGVTSHNEDISVLTENVFLVHEIVMTDTWLKATDSSLTEHA